MCREVCVGDAPDQDLSQIACELLVDKLLGVGKLDVHVAVGTNESATVFGFTPLQSDNNVLINPMLLSISRL